MKNFRVMNEQKPGFYPLEAEGQPPSPLPQFRISSQMMASGSGGRKEAITIWSSEEKCRT